MKLARKDLPGINEAINSLLTDESKKSKLLTYALVKNIKIIENEVEAIQKAYETDSSEYTEFVTKMREVFSKYGRKDNEGNLVDSAGNPGFDLYEESDRPKLEKEKKALEKKYKDAIEARKIEVAEYEKFLQEEVEVPLNKINFEALPEDIQAGVMYTLDSIITDPAV